MATWNLLRQPLKRVAKVYIVLTNFENIFIIFAGSLDRVKLRCYHYHTRLCLLVNLDKRGVVLMKV